MLVYNSRDRDPRVWNEAESLASAGIQVDVYMLRRQGQPTVENEPGGFRVIRFSEHSPKSRRPWTFLRAYRELFKSIGERRYHALQCHDASTLPAGTILARRQRIPLIYDAHEYFPDHRRLDDARWWRRVLEKVSVNLLSERLLIRRAEAVITVSRGIAQLIQNRYELPSEPVVVRNVQRYRNVEPASPGLRGIIRSNKPAHLLLFQGAVTPLRGLETCLRVTARTRDTHLVTLGPVAPGYRNKLIAEAESLGIGERFSLVDPVPFEQLLDLTASADVGLYLIPTSDLTLSYRYSLPNKVFEFVMARLPFVATGLPEIESVVRERSIGICVDPSDTESAAVAVRRLLEDKDLRTEMKNELDRAARDLSWDKEQEQLLAVYRSLR